MKHWKAVLALVIAFAIGSQVGIRIVGAQSPAQQGIVLDQVQTTLTACQLPTWASVQNGIVKCFVNGGTAATSAEYFKTCNGGTCDASWTLLGPSAAAVVPAGISTQAGICITGYNATTGQFVTSPCVNSFTGGSPSPQTRSGAVTITKGDVIGTNLGVVVAAPTGNVTLGAPAASLQ